VGSAARFNRLQGLAIDAGNNLYVADTNNHTIRKVALSTGVVTTVAGLGRKLRERGRVWQRRALQFSVRSCGRQRGHSVCGRHRKSYHPDHPPSGLVSTLAGLATSSGSADGTGSAARFDSPTDVAVDLSGNVYVADTDNFTIRKIVSSTGAVSTVAGWPYGGSTDGSGSAVRFFGPTGHRGLPRHHALCGRHEHHTVRVGLMPMIPAIPDAADQQVGVCRLLLLIERHGLGISGR